MAPSTAGEGMSARITVRRGRRPFPIERPPLDLRISRGAPGAPPPGIDPGGGAVVGDQPGEFSTTGTESRNSSGDGDTMPPQPHFILEARPRRGRGSVLQAVTGSGSWPWCRESCRRSPGLVGDVFALCCVASRSPSRSALRAGRDRELLPETLRWQNFSHPPGSLA